MIIGKLPFDSETNFEIKQQIINNDVIFPDDITINPDLKSLITKMLAKDRRQRIKIFEIMEDRWLFPKTIIDLDESL